MRLFKVRTQSSATGHLSPFKESGWVQLHDQWEKITIEPHPTDNTLLQVKFEDALHIYIFSTEMLRQLLAAEAEKGSSFLDFTVYKKAK